MGWGELLRMLNTAPLDFRANFVLVVLAAHANGDGTAWPSVSRIASETGMGTATVKRALQRIESAGVVEIEHRPGRSMVVKFSTGVDQIDPGVDQSDPGTWINLIPVSERYRYQSDPDLDQSDPDLDQSGPHKQQEIIIKQKERERRVIHNPARAVAPEKPDLNSAIERHPSGTARGKKFEREHLESSLAALRLANDSDPAEIAEIEAQLQALTEEGY